MANYAFIADYDPGGDLEAAFATMAGETFVQLRAEYIVTDVRIAGVLGMTAAVEFLDAVEAAVPERAINWIRSTGVNICHPETIAILNAINPPHKDLVLAMGEESVLQHPGLTIEQLKKARLKRAAGEV
jgi:hypothetical protein